MKINDEELTLTYEEAEDGWALFVKSTKFDYTITIKNEVFNKNGSFTIDYSDDMNKDIVKDLEQHSIMILSHVIEGVVNYKD